MEWGNMCCPFTFAQFGGVIVSFIFGSWIQIWKTKEEDEEGEEEEEEGDDGS
jgi:hypothetical protein